MVRSGVLFGAAVDTSISQMKRARPHKTKLNVEDDPRWAAVIGRLPSDFFYSVETTGVYCRPSCAARRPKPANVRFHLSTQAAERAGFRACKRCRPHGATAVQRHATTVARVCRMIESSERPPKKAELARAAAMSPSQLQRLFKAVTGMTPSAYRDGGAHTDVRFAVAECSLGSVLVAASARGVCAVLLGDDPDTLVHDLERRFPRANLIGCDRGFEGVVAKVVAVVERPALGLDLPLDLRGTVFQQRVWDALRAIPPGHTTSYSELAQRIGAPKAARAVAAACAANVIAVAIPCHRVVRSDGALSGYRWGVDRKRELLDREKAPR